MFGSKPIIPYMLGDLIAQRKRLVFNCMACKTITSKRPSEQLYKPNMELNVLEQICVCPECGVGNVSGEAKQLVLTIED